MVNLNYPNRIRDTCRFVQSFEGVSMVLLASVWGPLPVDDAVDGKSPIFPNSRGRQKLFGDFHRGGITTQLTTKATFLVIDEDEDEAKDAIEAVSPERGGAVVSSAAKQGQFCG